jgi:periplasmic protein TonB
VFETLIETKRQRHGKRTLGVGVVSLVAHTVVIGAAVFATLNAGSGDTAIKVDTAMVYLEQQQQQKPPEPQPVQLDVPLRGFQTVIAPTEIPTNIPPVNLQEHFDPKDYSGSGVEGGTGTGVIPTGNEVFMEAIVEEKPSILAAEPPIYPSLLQQAGIQGRVMVQFIIDTTGRAEPGSIKVLESPNPGFDGPSRNYILHAIWRPARVHGRPVRVLVTQPVLYQLTSK